MTLLVCSNPGCYNAGLCSASTCFNTQYQNLVHSTQTRHNPFTPHLTADKRNGILPSCGAYMHETG